MPVGPPNQAADLSFLGPSRGLRRRRLLASVACQVLDITVLCAVQLAIRSRLASSAQAVGLPAFDLRTLVLLMLCAATWHFLLVATGMYTLVSRRSRLDYLVRLLIGANCCTCVIGLVHLVLHGNIGLWTTLLWFWIGSVGGLSLVRIAIAVGYVSLTWRRPRRTIVIGVGEVARKAERQCRCDPRCRVIGIVEPSARSRSVEHGFIVHSGGASLGTLDNLESILAQHPADVVVIALPFATHFDQIGHAINVCQKAGVESHYLTSNPTLTRPNVPSILPASTKPQDPSKPQG